MLAKVAVIIPHYARTRGVLARTLAAIFEQDCPNPLSVIVVDDDSPVPAASELGDLSDAARAAVRVIQRPNGGPAAAKNTGLAALPDDATFIALSDCDDLWKPRRLSRGLAAMDAGYDLFFCDHRREGAEISTFQRCGVQRDQHLAIDPVNDIYQWRTSLFDACLRASIVGLSTVLFRRGVFQGVTFAEDVGLADDIIFALEATRRTSKVAFTFAEDVFYTAADNASIVSEWYSNKSLRVILGLALAYHKAGRDFSLNEANRAFLTRRIDESRVDFATTAAGLLLRGRKVQPDLLMQYFRADHRLPPAIVKAAFGMIAKALPGRR